MRDDIRAESLKLLRRPAVWALLAIALGLSVTFTHLIPYAGYAGGTGGPRADRGLAAMLPDQLVGNSIGLPFRSVDTRTARANELHEFSDRSVSRGMLQRTKGRVQIDSGGSRSQGSSLGQSRSFV